MTGRPDTSTGRLIRLGFMDLEAARRCLSEWQPEERILEAVGGAADPDQALMLLTEMRDDLTSIPSDSIARGVTVLGASAALGEHVRRHPEHWSEMDEVTTPTASEVRRRLLTAVGAEVTAAYPVASGENAVIDLRVEYRRNLLGIAARDVVDGQSMSSIAEQLSDLADAVLEAALAIARQEVGPSSYDCDLAVIGMGKCGGRELNYVSDVDVIFVISDDKSDQLPIATKLASALMRICSAPTSEGSIWEVDAALRPEGKAGALVRTVSSHIDYYERWAKTWEFQALLKARLVAGDAGVGNAYLDSIVPFVWSAADRDGFVDDVQSMRQRVEKHVSGADREIKLSPGGLRDVEFSVQLLQLVHGRSDVMLRSPTTLTALEALANWGYVGREDAATLTQAYEFLRTMEHRIQLQRLRRTHVVPDDDVELRRLARSIECASVEELEDRWQRNSREVRRIHEKLFYRPLLNAVARLDAGEARLTLDQAGQRLHALGYRDPQGALRHLEALTSGVSRRAAIQRTLLPVLLGWFADAPDPDEGLLGFRQVSDALGATPWYLRLLRDESAAAWRMARVLASSRYATDLLLRAPDAVAMFADDDELEPRTREQLIVECHAAAARHDDPLNAIAAVRALRRRELLRISVADVLNMMSADHVSMALSDVTAATLVGGLDVAERIVPDSAGVEFAIVAMGRFGGCELGYGSDADVMFVYRARPGVDDQTAGGIALAIANELRRLLTAPSTDPALEIDADLRPEGRNGPLVRSLASFEAYYERWSSPWEAQALLRADVIAGSQDLATDFLALIDPIRYPTDGVDETVVREVRRLKARMEAERLPRGADPTVHTKLGRGGLSDVEWTIQLLQMQHGATIPQLRTTRTLPALRIAAEAGLIETGDADLLAEAWSLATSVRNAYMLARGKSSDMLPKDLADLRAVAYVLGYAPEDAGRLQEDYRRITRRARTVVEREFFGLREQELE